MHSINHERSRGSRSPDGAVGRGKFSKGKPTGISKTVGVIADLRSAIQQCRESLEDLDSPECRRWAGSMEFRLAGASRMQRLSGLREQLRGAEVKLQRQSRRKTLKAWRYETCQTRVALRDEELQLEEAVDGSRGHARLYLCERLAVLRVDIETHETLEQMITQELGDQD